MRKLKISFNTLSLIVVVAVLFIIFTILQPNMATMFNIRNILVQVSLTAIAAAGMTFAFTAGVFDMSIGSILALVSVFMAKIASTRGLLPAIFFCVIIGIVVGIANGLIVTKLHIQAFAATLVSMIIIRGMAVLMSSGADIPLYGMNSVKFISSGTIAGIPFPIILMVIVYVICYFIYYKTAFGMKVRSVGSNESAAHTSGIKVDRIVIAAFVMTALTAVISSFMKTAQVMFGKASIGEDFSLEVMTTVVLGGTAISGGSGNLTGSLIASILIAVIKNGLNLLNVNTYYQQLVIGIVFILALILNGIREMRAQSKLKEGIGAA